jgi:pimeloyl-ACP methyl ester carboxylesterase
MAPHQIARRVSAPDGAPPAGRSVTLAAVHGNGGGAHRFARVVPLMPPDVTLFAVTLPGFAAVPADPALRTLPGYAACLAEMVAPLPRPRVVLGHGIGGSIALELVQRQADLVDGLILHAPVGTRLDRRLFPRLMAVPGARALGKWLFAARPLRPIFRRLLFSHAVPQGYLDRFFEEYRQCSVFSQMFDLITPAWFRGLRPTDLPSALLWGEAERLLPVDQIGDYRALLPRVTVRRVPGWGHFPMIEQPDAYAAEIADLARSLATQAAAPQTASEEQDRETVSSPPLHRNGQGAGGWGTPT